MHLIKKYSFGSITIGDKTYSKDIMIVSDEILPNWWRKEGHNLHLEDLQEIIKRKPDILVIGTGYSGIMKVSKEILSKLEDMGIKTIVKKSPEAVSEYNALMKGEKRIAAALHLTC
ncbi:MAG: Mth938-like domain-containing protein [Promethearchaeota archaeon]